MRVKILILVSILCLITLFGSLCGTGHPVYAAERLTENTVKLTDSREWFTPLRTQDMVMEGGWLALHFIDYSQTLQIADNPDRYYETNFILGKHPSRGTVNLFFVAGALVHVGMVWAMPEKTRLAFQGASIIGKGIIVISNKRIDLSFVWPF